MTDLQLAAIFAASPALTVLVFTLATAAAVARLGRQDRRDATGAEDLLGTVELSAAGGGAARPFTGERSGGEPAPTTAMPAAVVDADGAVAWAYPPAPAPAAGRHRRRS